MTISPLAAAAVPAGIAAFKLAQHTVEERPFRKLLSRLAGPEGNSADTTANSDAELTAFLQMVNERLAAAGFDTSLSFEISSDAGGNLIIGGNHPQQEDIQQILGQDGNIAAAFHRLAESHQLASAADRHLSFAEQYVSDPTVARSSIAPSAADFRVVINEDEIEVV